jgi:outer membrane protein, heavy metal efflux system
MTRILICMVGLLAYNSMMVSQDHIDEVLAEVEKNNTTLAALRQHTDAEKLANKTGIYLQNPEVGFNYLWGSPSVMGKRMDVSISQSFDFPTVYKYQNQISELRNDQAELGYLKQQKNIMLQTRILLFDIIHLNALESQYRDRLSHATRIAASVKSRFESGDISILEHNKAQINLLSTGKELKMIEIERDALLTELAALNGGEAIGVEENSFPTPDIPGDFDLWYEEAQSANPILNWLKQEIEVSHSQTKLNSAKGLPKFQAGYMSEGLTGDKFHGLTIGLSIPLWENKNRVNYAKANSLAVESVVADQKIQFYNQLKRLHNKSVLLQENTNDYKASLELFDNSELLSKAFDEGEINLMEYMLELGIFYESYVRALEIERDLNKTVAELLKYM